MFRNAKVKAAEPAAVDLLWTETIESPVGPLVCVTTDVGHVCALYFGEEHRGAKKHLGKLSTLHARAEASQAARLIRSYLEGSLGALAGITASPRVGTEFQRQVWRALCDIPVGETRSYLDVARAIGRPQAVRAVGMANAHNPISLVVPCHRVIGADGSLTGYGGGLRRKEWLLRHEGWAPPLIATRSKRQQLQLPQVG